VQGGPEAPALRTGTPLVQALVRAGHAVLVPNVRGSTGYGKAWYAADDVRRRLGSVADLAALHAWLPSVGLDQGRAALHGGSYGGLPGAPRGARGTAPGGGAGGRPRATAPRARSREH